MILLQMEKSLKRVSADVVRILMHVKEWSEGYIVDKNPDCPLRVLENK